MRSLLIALTAVTFLVASLGNASADEAEDDGLPLLTLAEVFERLDRISPLNRIAESRIDEAEAQAREARMLRMPRFEFNASLAPVPNIDEDDLSASDVELLRNIFSSLGPWVRSDLSMIVPITSFGKIRTLRQLAGIGVDVAGIELEHARMESRFEGLRGYVALQWYVEVDRLLREAERRLEDAEETLEDRLDDGDRSARNALRQLTIYRTEFVRLRGEADALQRVAYRTLRNVLQLREGFRVEALDTDPLAETLPTLDEVVATAFRDRQDLAMLDAAVAAREAQLQLTRRNWWPDAFLGAGFSVAWAPGVVSQDGPFIYDPFNRLGLGVAVGLRWRLDPFGQPTRVQRHEAMVVTVERQREGARLAVEAEVTEAWSIASNAERLLQAYADGQRAARAWLNQVSFQFDQGLAEFDDLVDPLRAYYDMAGKYQEAVLRYRLAVADLALKTGQRDLLRWPGAHAAE